MRALFEPINTAPPWDWNPIGVGIAAFNDVRRTMIEQQEEKRRQEESAIDNAIKRETLPYAATAARLELENLRADIASKNATAQSALALADYRKSLAQGEMESDVDVLSAQHPELSYLLGVEAEDALTPPQTRRAAPVSDDSLRLAPQGMLDRDTPVQLNEVNTDGLPTASADNALTREFGIRPSNVLENLASKLPPEAKLADSSSELTPTAMAAMSAADKALYLPRELRSVSARADNPLINLPIMTAQNEPEPEAASAPTDTMSPLQRYVQAEKQLESNYYQNRARLSKKERGRYDGQMSAQLKQLPFVVNQKFGLSSAAYNKVRNWAPDSFERFEDLSREAQGSIPPDTIVEFVNKENEDKFKELYQRGKGTPAEVDLDKAKKTLELIDGQIAAETDPITRSALEQKRNSLRADVTGVRVSGREYLQGYMSARAAATDDQTKKGLDENFNVPNDDTVLDLDRLDAEARGRGVKENDLPALRAFALENARKTKALAFSRGKDGLTILSDADLTDDAINAVRNGAPVGAPAGRTTDSSEVLPSFSEKEVQRIRDRTSARARTVELNRLPAEISVLERELKTLTQEMPRVPVLDDIADTVGLSEAGAKYKGRRYNALVKELREKKDRLAELGVRNDASNRNPGRSRREDPAPKSEQPSRVQGGLDFGLGEALSKLLTPEESSDPELRDEFAKNFSWRYDGKPPKITKLGRDSEPNPWGDKNWLDETWPSEAEGLAPTAKFKLRQINGTWYAEETESPRQKNEIVNRLVKRAEDPNEAPKLNNLERAILEKEGYYQPTEELAFRRAYANTYPGASMLGDAVNAIYGWKYDGREPGPAWQGSRVYKKRE